MSTALDVIRPLKRILADPNDRLAMNDLRNGLAVTVSSDVEAWYPGERADFARMLFKCAGRIVTRWEDRDQRARFLTVAKALLRVLEGQPMRLPAAWSDGDGPRPVQGLSEGED